MFDTGASRTKMEQALEHFAGELKKIRTGRAHPDMLDSIMVEAYGAKMPLNQVANVTVPEPQLLQITPFDPSQIQAIAAAIRHDQSLGFNPSDDGRVVRVPIPALTEERRRQIIKQAGEKGEDARIALRGIRQDALKDAKRRKDNKELSEDDVKRAEKEIDGLMAEYQEKIDLDLKSKRERYSDNLMDEQTPRHIGYIVDGNRRWARQHGLPVYEGHLAGYSAVQEVVQATFEAGVSYVSAYVFSTENWKRSQDEVNKLMGLALKVAKSDVNILLDNNVKVRVLGSRVGVDPKILKEIDDLEARSVSNDGGTLALCFNYGGQIELVDAFKKMIDQGVLKDDITPELIAENLYAPDIPPVDLIVRTGGDKRISNFMLWRAAYSEFMFLDKYWPDMTKEDVAIILKEYSERNRRFGG